MHDVALQSGWETFLLAAPFVGMLVVGIFRLDTFVSASRHEPGQPRPSTGIEENGRVLLNDPDGRP